LFPIRRKKWILIEETIEEEKTEEKKTYPFLMIMIIGRGVGVRGKIEEILINYYLR
jgi:hypothetical protein